MRTIIILCLLSINSYFGQVKITPTHSNQQWFQYYNTAQISKKMSILTDIGYRWSNSISNPKNALVRAGLYYSFSEISKIGIGYANFDYFTDKKESKNENRLYFDYSYKYTIQSLKLDNRFRLEERFFKTPSDEYSQTRLRYSLSLNRQIWKFGEKERKISIFETNELFYTIDKKSNTSYLDQIRFIIGSSFQLNKNLSFQLSYNAQFNKKITENKSYNFTNIVWLTIRQTIDFSTHKE